MYIGEIKFRDVLFESNEISEQCPRTKKYMSSYTTGKSYSEISELAKTLYEVYIQNLKNIAKVHRYIYITKEILIANQGDYLMNTVDKKLFYTVDIMNNPDLNYADRISAEHIIADLYKNGPKFFQPIISITNSGPNKRHKCDVFMTDGIHRFLALCAMVDNDDNIPSTLMLTIDGSVYEYCDLSVPDWVYELLVEHNEIIHLKSPSLNCIYKYDEYYIDTKKWYRIKARNAGVLHTILIVFSFIIDYLYRIHKRGITDFYPHPLIHDEKLIKE